MRVKKMFKVGIIMFLALSLVACGKKSPKDIVKEAYDEYGYKYALAQLKKMADSEEYKPEDINEALNFLAEVEFGENLGTLEEKIEEENNAWKDE